MTHQILNIKLDRRINLALKNLDLKSYDIYIENQQSFIKISQNYPTFFTFQFRFRKKKCYQNFLCFKHVFNPFLVHKGKISQLSNNVLATNLKCQHDSSH